MNKIVLLGWVGTAGIIIAYILISIGFYTGDSLGYFIINSVASVFIVISSLHKKDYPPAGLNVFLFVVGLIAIVRILMN